MRKWADWIASSLPAQANSTPPVAPPRQATGYSDLPHDAQKLIASHLPLQDHASLRRTSVDSYRAQAQTSWDRKPYVLIPQPCGMTGMTTGYDTRKYLVDLTSLDHNKWYVVCQEDLQRQLQVEHVNNRSHNHSYFSEKLKNKGLVAMVIDFDRMYWPQEFMDIHTSLRSNKLRDYNQISLFCLSKKDEMNKIDENYPGGNVNVWRRHLH